MLFRMRKLVMIIHKKYYLIKECICSYELHTQLHTDTDTDSYHIRHTTYHIRHTPYAIR